MILFSLGDHQCNTCIKHFTYILAHHLYVEKIQELGESVHNSITGTIHQFIFINYYYELYFLQSFKSNLKEVG